MRDEDQNEYEPSAEDPDYLDWLENDDCREYARDMEKAVELVSLAWTDDERSLSEEAQDELLEVAADYVVTGGVELSPPDLESVSCDPQRRFRVEPEEALISARETLGLDRTPLAPRAVSGLPLRHVACRPMRSARRVRSARRTRTVRAGCSPGRRADDGPLPPGRRPRADDVAVPARGAA